MDRKRNAVNILVLAIILLKHKSNAQYVNLKDNLEDDFARFESTTNITESKIDKEDSSTEIPGADKEETINIKKKLEADNETVKKNLTKKTNATEEVCVGMVEYCNLTKEEYVKMIEDYVFPHDYEWILIATHTIVFIGGLVGNALVCVAVYRNHTMRTVTNYFIVNLAVADFMVILFCLPPTVLWDVTETWFFGSAMCKFILYFQVSFFLFN